MNRRGGFASTKKKMSKESCIREMMNRSYDCNGIYVEFDALRGVFEFAWNRQYALHTKLYTQFGAPEILTFYDGYSLSVWKMLLVKNITLLTPAHRLNTWGDVRWRWCINEGAMKTFIVKKKDSLFAPFAGVVFRGDDELLDNRECGLFFSRNNKG